MANSKYKYVKSFEVDDMIMQRYTIIIHVDARDFCRFSQLHNFEKPNDEKALELMNECANAVLKQFPEVIFSYGYGAEFSFIFKKETDFYKRRGSKILSLIVSFFTSTYVTKWRALFPHKELKYAPSFRARVFCCELLQAYLLWRQDECLWQLIKSGKSKKEAQDTLRGSLIQDKNELLYQSFNIGFHQGTCILKTKVEEIVKHKADGSPVIRPRSKVLTVHSENIASKSFWNENKCLSEEELGQFCDELKKTRPEYIKYWNFQYESRLKLSTWIVVRIDGRHFHSFSDDHEFEKPNDAQALNLMNACAVAVLEEFRDVVFAYGVSDEYSFVLNKDSQLYQRCASEIVSSVVSFFSSTYTMRWNEFFPQKEMKYLPYFDGRAVCYPSSEIKDYLAWRQVDCHINNQYNTCFWLLVKSGKSKGEAQNELQKTQTPEKNEILDRLTGVPNYYDTLLPMFRQGSSVFWDKEKKVVVVEHCNIIETDFWEAHPQTLDKKVDRFKALQNIVLLIFFIASSMLAVLVTNLFSS